MTAALPIDIDCAVLAGGLGTRLAHLQPALPKILTPIGGVPFIEYFLDWIETHGFRRVVLCLGHRSEQIRSYLSGLRSRSFELALSVESSPRGTAGAVGVAASHLASDPVAVMNGDSVVDFSFRRFLDFHLREGNEVSLVCASAPSRDFGRYGNVTIGPDARVSAFSEKATTSRGSWVSAGVYLIGGSQRLRLLQMDNGSIEKDFLERQPGSTIGAYSDTGDFIDIGTEESLRSADEFFRAWKRSAERAHDH